MKFPLGLLHDCTVRLREDEHMDLRPEFRSPLSSYHPTEKPIPNKSVTFELRVHSNNTLEDMLCNTLPSSMTSLTESFLHGFSQGFFFFFHAMPGTCPLSSLYSWLVCTLRASSPIHTSPSPCRGVERGPQQQAVSG